MVHPERASVDGKVWLENHGYTNDSPDGSGVRARSSRSRRSRARSRRARRTTSTMSCPTRKTMRISPISNRARLEGSTRRRGRLPSTRPRHPTRGRAAPGWTPRTASGLPSTRVNRVAVFDTRNERFQEWLAPTPWSAPYDVVVDKNGDIWTGSVTNDRVLRLNPKSGQSSEYLLPGPRTSEECSWTIRRIRSRSGWAAITAPRLSKSNLWGEASPLT